MFDRLKTTSGKLAATLHVPDVSFCGVLSFIVIFLIYISSPDKKCRVSSLCPCDRCRHGKLDWKKLARVDVDEVVSEVDLTVLQQLLDEVNTGA